MDINRTGLRSTPIDDPAQKVTSASASFPKAGMAALDANATTAPASVPAGVAPADLRDPAKTEGILRQCFGTLVESAAGKLGVPDSEAQKQRLVDYMQNDPVLRGKMLNYLDQTVK